MKICFEPMMARVDDDQERLDELTAHLQRRRVEVLPFTPDMEVDGMIAHFPTPETEIVDHLTYTVKSLQKPALALWRKPSGVMLPREIEGIRVVRYSQPYIARLAIDVFLEAHCGYRVPLGADDIQNHPEVE